MKRKSNTPTWMVSLAVLGLIAGALAGPPNGQRLQVAYSFRDVPDGANPFQSPLVLDNSGSLYGTSLHGGTGSNGTVFKVTRTGKESVLYRFAAGAKGWAPSPESGVIRDEAGNLYGTEAFSGPQQKGSVFKLGPAGKFTILHDFTGSGDGDAPSGGLVRDASGNLYGTASGGGDLQGCGNGCGTVFKLDSSGKFTVLYTFTGGGDGGIPTGSLVLDSAGNLYGTTLGGGAFSQGTVFMLTNTGQERSLYSFTATGQSDGMEPAAGLVRDSSGTLYGTTFYGGGGSCFDGFNPGCGTVFKIDKSGTFSVLHSFTGGDDGGWSTAALALDSKGNLYGTASGAGRFGAGTLFSIRKTGAFSLLHSFTGGGDGARPMGTMTIDSTGTIYGTTAGGGAFGFGEVFKFVP